METRKWLNISPSTNNSLNNTQFKVLSYNLLADVLAFKDRFPYCSNKMLRWEHRHKRVLEELKLTGADILLIQEVDHFNNFYKKELNLLGYKSIFDKDKAKQHGICIAFKKDKFKLISNLKVDFDNYPIGKNICQTKCILQLAKVQFKESELGLILTNNHLFWNPIYDYERARQFSILTEAIKEFAKDCDFPVISGGDFNSTPDKLGYLAITRALQDNEENMLNVYNEINTNLNREIDSLKEELIKCREDLAALIALREADNSKYTEDANDKSCTNDIKDTSDTKSIDAIKDANSTNDVKGANCENDTSDVQDLKNSVDLESTIDVKNTRDASDAKDANNASDTKDANYVNDANDVKDLSSANNTIDTKDIDDANNAKNTKKKKSKKSKNNKNNAKNSKDSKDTRNTKKNKYKKYTKGAKDSKFIMCRAIQSLEQKIKAKESKLAMLENPGLPIEEIVKIIQSSEPFQSAYSSYTKLDPTYLEPKYGYEPIYTNFTPIFKGTLDYLFYRSSSKQQIEVEAIFSLPDRETLGDGIPNLIYGSDHLSIAAKFIFK